MSKHTITAEYKVKFRLHGMPSDEHETAYPTLEIEFSFRPGSPATGPTYSCGGQPADPAEIEIIKATLVKGDGLDPTPDQVHDWALEYLESDEGYFAMCDVAETDRHDMRNVL